MNSNVKPSNRVVVADVIDHDSYAPATLTTDYIAAKNFGNFMAIVLWGDLGANNTINAKFQQATDSSGTGVKDITSKAITAVVSTASPIPHNKQAVINCRADELDAANDFDYIRLSITLTSGASPNTSSELGAVLLGLDARLEPGTDATSVVEVV